MLAKLSATREQHVTNSVSPGTLAGLSWSMLEKPRISIVDFSTTQEREAIFKTKSVEPATTASKSGTGISKFEPRRMQGASRANN